ncbi:cytochrome c oxidase subunit 3 [Altibacter sp.]|uniref:cytochrome c oxidase subunit 3 n=1 Tax=Altibacter sp. TaxID=2024823 RepID=UPI0025858C5E|nr:cytochrome c oxidase subunit 3 [Altibacter sp.]MCW8981958.1 cytochrome c oxidase subunit 3 [Altibacter sp.]MCW9037288.1 cytochrome c oxidase subunit 3 [Altibacter sp.]
MGFAKIDYKNLYYPPGGILLWIVIYLELITFGIALVFMALDAQENPQLFHDSRLLLNRTYGMINTVFLLSSGWCMAQSVQLFKKQEYQKSRKFLLITILGGLLFLGLKSIEYYDKAAVGLRIDYNTFFSYYWMLTLFHVVHVLVGLVILGSLYLGLRDNPYGTKTEDIEAGGAFWHLCDLIWLLLFPVLYLLY